MPRPRFDKLEPARRAAILTVAAEEFAEHGFEAASYNRIIERSGLSKGAIYYYFDDKEDLYVTVLKDALERLVIHVDDLSSARDADTFWREFTRWYRQSLVAFQQDPHAVALARSLVKAMGRGAAHGVVAELRRFGLGWMQALVRHGQEVGAVRSDLPENLLPSVLMALEEGIDLWLGERIGSMDVAEIEQLTDVLTGLYRRVAEAPPVTATKRKQKGKG
jgi:AcrR family transcriptional regulator